MAPFYLCHCRVGGSDPGDPGTNVDTVVPAVKTNPRNSLLSMHIGDGKLNNDTGNWLLPTWEGRLWAPNAILKIGFKGGDSWQRDQVITIAPEWTNYASLEFTFPASGPYDILVDFVAQDANFSVIGVDSLYCTVRNVASMNLGFVTQDTPENERRGLILHEFGHAIGATHVLAAPISSISWNKSKVYQDLAQPPTTWDKKTVDGRMFQAYPNSLAHDFGDRASIMQYAFPASWTTNGQASPWNFEISQHDQDLMRFYYPYSTDNDAGVFNSMEIRHWNDPQATTIKDVQLNSSYRDDRRVIVGLNFFDFDNEKQNFRLLCTAGDPAADTSQLKMYSWAGTVNYMSGLSYLDVNDRLWFMQSGNFSTTDVRSPNDERSLRPLNSKRVTFTTAFDSPPKVVCFITGLDFWKDRNIRIKTYATDIDNEGFTIHVDSWSDSKMARGDASWIAYPSDRSDICSGSFNTMDVRPWNKPQADNHGVVKFDNPFYQRPRVFMAANWLDYGKQGTYCWRVSAENITTDGLAWNMQSWWTAVMYSAGASYLAWAY